ncbi:MAG: UDP-N-acetylmuramate:L-alanyl-gamma-D-glutamyl-meso-diaminopimelate ligase [Magnetococcales bacterium]|nr:UDP-N-acetylmuramate:L-alanyl-gamma-D-glutamyl-meso-diaminopimelate ligase [Magnetococcales bacterium]
MKHLYIIGICGTAMAGIAALAQDAGWRVTGSDSGVYPPMSTFLGERGIPIHDGFRAANLDAEAKPDMILVGNTISRGNPELEAVLDRAWPYRSGAEWIHRHMLEGRHPVVVTGTHGKTTTSSMISWLWEHAGWKPGFLIGGIPANFNQGVRFPESPWVVLEGDEYDTAFCDKRSKFLHYHPRTLILHNLEFDHADIYADLEAIRIQFRHLLRLVPQSGVILAHGDDPEIETLAQGAFGPVRRYGLEGDYEFKARLDRPDGRAWTVMRDGERLFSVSWPYLGRHNVLNGLAAAAAALSHNMDPETVRAGLESFKGVRRRLQLRFEAKGISVYDDFAHHPTAIATTLEGVQAAVGESGRVWAVVEPRSNTMRRRIHQDRIPTALQAADRVLLARPAANGLADKELLDVEQVVHDLNANQPGMAQVVEDAKGAIDQLVTHVQSGDHVIIMSNGGFGGIHERLQSALA